jgi:phosphoribosyl-dephospho-CoA transferase
VAARRTPGAAAGQTCLGIPLPPSRGRARIALRAPATAMLRSRVPLRLAEVLATADLERRPALEQLQADAEALGLVVRVHGSLAWQHLTGEPYLTAASDLDLLLAAGSRWQLSAALRMLQLWERRTGLKADAEMVLPAGGVAWRELAGGAAQVVAKREASVALLSREEALAGLPAGSAP